MTKRDKAVLKESMRQAAAAAVRDVLVERHAYWPLQIWTEGNRRWDGPPVTDMRREVYRDVCKVLKVKP